MAKRMTKAAVIAQLAGTPDLAKTQVARLLGALRILAVKEAVGQLKSRKIKSQAPGHPWRLAGRVSGARSFLVRPLEKLDLARSDLGSAGYQRGEVLLDVLRRGLRRLCRSG
jgi:hypothetical protein